LVSVRQSSPTVVGNRIEPDHGPDLDSGDDGITGSIIAIGISVAMNVLTLVGVVAWGWPAGNVYLLFWIENLIIGCFSVIRVRTARGTGDGGAQLRVNGRPVRGTPTRYALFFLVHYGIFCLVHGVFTAVVASQLGIDAGFLLLGFPAIVIAVRYLVELVATWFGRGGLRHQVSSAQAMAQPYPRIVVLHLAVLLAFWLTLDFGRSADGFLGVLGGAVSRVFSVLPGDLQSQPVKLVAVLVLVKTAVDVYTTRRITRRR